MNVFNEASKAETRLNRLAKAEDAAIERVQAAYTERRAKLVATLDVQVRAALRGAGVLEREDHSAELLSAAGYDVNAIPAESVAHPGNLAAEEA